MELKDRIAAVEGPAAIVGHIGSPYDGCFYQTVVGLVLGEVTALTVPWHRQGLNSWLNYHLTDDLADINVAPPEHGEYAPLCIRTADIEKVFTPMHGRDELEVCKATEIEEYVDYSFYGYVLDLMWELGLPRPDGFKCRECDKPFEDSLDVKFYSSEFRGNGGVGVTMDRPTCFDCYDNRVCPVCGAEWPDGHDYEYADVMHLDDEYHCASCVPDRVCQECSDTVSMNAGRPSRSIAAFRLCLCEDCFDKRESEVQRSYDFDSFSISMPQTAVEACGAPGNVDDAVRRWSKLIPCPEQCTKEAARRELADCGAWDEKELDDDEDNWRRLIWIAAGRLKEEGIQDDEQ